MHDFVVIGLCTCRRPILLQACLNSLAQQKISPDLSVVIIVVDNEAEPNNKVIIENFAMTCPFPVHYVHEPRPGIAVARNAILDKALELNADWIAMLDDDERADPEWLAMLMAAEYRDTPIIYGLNIIEYPTNSKWVIRREDRVRGIEGELSIKAATNNVRFSRAVAQAVRFNEALGFMPGEDVDFFDRARGKGFFIRRSLKAITYETPHASKLTYFGQMRTTYGEAASKVKRHSMMKGSWSATANYLPNIVKNLFASLICIPLVIIWIGFNQRQYCRYALKAGKKSASALGYMMALLGRDAKTYAKISGY